MQLQHTLQLICTCCVFASVTVYATDHSMASSLVIDRSIAPLLTNGYVALWNSDGSTRYQYGSLSVFTPASITKIVTAWAAIQTLGLDAVFNSDVYRRGNTLIVKGLGDPMLLSEHLAVLANAPQLRRANCWDGLAIDDSWQGDSRVDGISISANPYDSQLNALTVNFNSGYLRKNADGSIASAESQTPLTNIAKRFGERFFSTHPQQHTVRLNIGIDQISIRNNTHQLLLRFFHNAGACFTNNRLQIATVTRNDVFLYQFKNPATLRTILTAMLQFSNNTIANQLAIHIGAQLHPNNQSHTLATGIQRISAMLAQHHIGQMTLIEASGISRNNRMDIQFLKSLLFAFRPWHTMLPAAKNKGITGVNAKSGTLTSVYHYAGYIQKQQQSLPFVIISEQPTNNRDEILSILTTAAFDNTDKSN